MHGTRKHFVEAIEGIIAAEHYTTACRVVNRLMPRCLRPRFDPEDFVGDAIVDIMSNPVRLAGYSRALLILVARRRMIDAARSPSSRLTPLDVDLIDGHPAAALQHDASELRQLLLGRVTDPGDRADVDLRCQGHTVREIAELTGKGVRAVQRFFKNFAEANEPY